MVVKILRTISTNRKIQFVLLTLFFVLINVTRFAQHGVKLVNDSHRYIEYADNLQKGFYIDSYNIWYIGYPLFILVFKTFGLGYGFLVGCQYLLALLAVFALYFASINIWRNPLSAFAGCLLFIVFIDITQWNSYILTESLYTSFTCFSLYYLSVCYTRKRSFAICIFTALLILFTFFIKPTGIGLLGATLSAILFEITRLLKTKLLKTTLLVLASFSFLLLVNRMLLHYMIMENYQKGEIIYAITTLPERPEYKLMIVTPPDNLYIPSSDTAPLIKVISFIFHHPFYWTQLFLAKAFFFLTHIRPYWSWSHNLYCLTILLPVYFFFFKEIIRRDANQKVKLFAMVYCLIHIVSISITSEDWDGRFLIPMLPVVMVFAGAGIGRVLKTDAHRM